MKLIKSIFATLLTVVVLIGAVVLTYKLFPLNYLSIIRQVSEEMDVDKYLIASLIKAESNFNPEAVSSAGAMGVMQLTDETAQFCAEKLGMTLNEGDIYKPEVNIRLGVYYLKRMLELFNGDEDLAVAAYNAGEGRVKEWLKDPTLSADGESLNTIPYEETRRHVEKIATYKKVYKLLYPNI